MKTAMKMAAMALACTTLAPTAFSASVDDYLGHWALNLPGGAGWLDVRQETHHDNTYLEGDILWYGGSVVPVQSIFMNEGTLVVVRLHNVPRIIENEEVVRAHTVPQWLEMELQGDTLQVTNNMPSNDGLMTNKNSFTADRIPPLPPKPNLEALEYGEPIEIFNGENLDGWSLINPDRENGWYVEDGVLHNNPEDRDEGVHYGNLRTDREFEDFNLTLEVNVPEGGNSGIYLRGIYEIQVLDSYGRGLDNHHMGAVYSRITPSESAEKPAGEWQTFDITLCDRHVNVVLNGTTIIDNQPLHGPTGGALWADQFRPGPIYLQGDHDAVAYRNMVLRPIVGGDNE